MKTLLAIALTATIALAAGTGCNESETNTAKADTEPTTSGPAAVFEKTMRYQGLGQYGRVWDLLHPAHQKLASRSFFDDCARENASTSGELDITVLEIYDDPIDILEIPEKTSKAVTYRIRLKGTDATQTQTSHAVNVDGEWRWVLASSKVPYYKRGECPLD